MSYYKSNITQQCQSDPENYNVWFPGEYPKTAFISIIICIENFWNHIQEIMNHGSFWEKGVGVWDEREI